MNPPRRLFLAGITCLFSATLTAQPPAPAPTPAAPPTAAKAAAVSPEHRASAAKVYQLMTAGTSLVDVMMGGFNNSIATLRQRGAPEAAIVEMQAAAKVFFTRIIDSGELLDAMTEMYARVYTREELDEMARFLGTPAGRKMMAKMPEVQEQSARISQDLLTRHRDELMKTFSAIGAKHGLQ